MRVSLESTTVRDIPILTQDPAGATCCPVIFVVAGFGGAVEVGLSIYLASHSVTSDKEGGSVA